MLSLHTWEELWDPAGGRQDWANPWHPPPSPLLTQNVMKIPKSRREKPLVSKQLMKKKQECRGIHSTSGKQFSELLLPHKGLVKQNPTPAHGELLHTGVFQCFQVLLVSHPLSPAGRFHPELKTPQLLPQQPQHTGIWAQKALRTRCIPKKKPPRSSAPETEPTPLTPFFDCKLHF